VAQYKHYLVHAYFGKVSDTIREEFMELPHKERMKLSLYAGWYHFLLDNPDSILMDRLNTLVNYWSPFR
jgi:hypothetical protein